MLMKTIKFLLLAIVCIGLISACGNKGPLYLADQEPTAQSAADAAVQPDEMATEEQDRED